MFEIAHVALDPGLLDYVESWELQRRLHAEVVAGTSAVRMPSTGLSPEQEATQAGHRGMLRLEARNASVPIERKPALIRHGRPLPDNLGHLVDEALGFSQAV